MRAALRRSCPAAVGIGGQAHHQALGRRGRRPPSRLQRFAVLALAAQVARDLAQRQLAQGGQIGRLEKILERLLDLRGRIDFAFAQTLAQLLDRDVDVDDLVGAREKGVRHGLAHLDAGDAASPSG